MRNAKEKLVELLDNFNRDLSPYAGNSKLFIVDDNCELADHLIANGVTFTSWIPVTDKLPEPLVDVLVYDSTGGRVELAFITRHFEWVGVCMNHEVSHWMPMPEGPATLETPEV